MILVPGMPETRTHQCEPEIVTKRKERPTEPEMAGGLGGGGAPSLKLYYLLVFFYFFIFIFQ